MRYRETYSSFISMRDVLLKAVTLKLKFIIDSPSLLCSVEQNLRNVFILLKSMGVSVVCFPPFLKISSFCVLKKN